MSTKLKLWTGNRVYEKILENKQHDSKFSIGNACVPSSNILHMKDFWTHFISKTLNNNKTMLMAWSKFKLNWW